MAHLSTVYTLVDLPMQMMYRLCLPQSLLLKNKELRSLNLLREIQLNCKKTEIVHIARSIHCESFNVSLPDAVIQTVPKSTCLGY